MSLEESRILSAKDAPTAITRSLKSLGLKRGKDYVVRQKRAYKGGPVIGWRVDPITDDDAGVSRFDSLVAENATWLRDITVRAGWPLIVHVQYTRSGQALSSVSYKVQQPRTPERPGFDWSRANVAVVGDSTKIREEDS